MAWIVAPSNESNSEPSNPLIEITSNIDQLIPFGDRNAANMPIKAAPRNAAQVPYHETPPDAPGSTRLSRFVTTLGGVGFNTPSSVAHVSALTAASAPANPIQVQS